MCRAGGVVRVIGPTRRIIGNVITNAIERFLIANDVFIVTTLPHGTAPAAAFIDAPRRESFESPYDFGRVSGPSTGTAIPCTLRLLGQGGFETRPYVRMAFRARSSRGAVAKW
jgi:hypothetical protein